MLIKIDNSLISEMLLDFELERGEMVRIKNSNPAGSEGYNRAINRLVVIDQSVEELKKQMADPERMHRLDQGGYTEEELKRFQDNMMDQVTNDIYEA